MPKALRIQHGSFGRAALLDLGHSLVVHAHPQSHMVIKVGGGDAGFTVDGEKVSLTRHRMALINDWEVHSYDHLSEHGHSLILALYLERQWLNLQRLAVTAVSYFPVSSIELNDSMLTIIDEITRLMLVEPEGHANCELLLSCLLRQVDQVCANSHQRVSGLVKTSQESELDRRLTRCIEWMQENLSSRTPVEDVVSRFGLSRAHAFYLFQRHFGMGPVAYWNVLRMEHAIHQLQGQKPAPIGGIAADLGFESQGNFTRFFRGIQGVAPRDYQSAAKLRRMA